MSINVTIRKTITTPPVVVRQLYRVNHDETLWRPNLPEVFPFLPNHYTKFGRDYQLLEKALNDMDGTMIPTKWRNLHLGGNRGDKATAFNNMQGYEMIGDPRADFINLRDLTKPVPKHEALACGGTFLAGIEGYNAQQLITNAVELSRTIIKNRKSISIIGNFKKSFIALFANNVLFPEYIDGNKPAPTLQFVLDNKLYFDAVTIDGTASGPVIRRFPQGGGARVYILLLASRPIRISLSRVTKLDMSQELPSPYDYP